MAKKKELHQWKFVGNSGGYDQYQDYWCTVCGRRRSVAEPTTLMLTEECVLLPENR
jgi:hypothetical protein